MKLGHRCNEPTPDDSWNRVIQDVDQAKFFIFQKFTVGVDNIFVELIRR